MNNIKGFKSNSAQASLLFTVLSLDVVGRYILETAVNIPGFYRLVVKMFYFCENYQKFSFLCSKHFLHITL